ncbi:hypothetical protein AOQ84DRAFT_183623 [Glonium stellatum]|uniref:Uncharacterized protein n=1 Tax=Glonium stellatum TaxID=574774 RepID=A0A8E2EPJ1_9PEZI|nr:hypothetical protein AOQ84DRAFT_183623 [Glonium stellatum]
MLPRTFLVTLHASPHYKLTFARPLARIQPSLACLLASLISHPTIIRSKLIYSPEEAEKKALFYIVTRLNITSVNIS